MGKQAVTTRRGAILVLAAFLMIFMMLLLAVSVDVGYMMTVQSQMDRATDAAALAGAGGLIEGADVAKLQAFECFALNPVGGVNLIADDPDWKAHLATLYDQHKEDCSIDTGVWNPDAPKPVPGEEDTRFAKTTVLPSAIRIIATRSNTPLFFARVFGQNDFSVTSEAIARYQPRDIAVVLDFSGSMNDDSELQRIYQQGSSVKPLIEANLLQIYQDLGSPHYGTLQFTPQSISSTNNTTIKKTLGLDKVAYPYPSGSWDNYIDYMKSSTEFPARAGYQKKYGFLTLINYWLEVKAAANQTPDLWKVRAQPITAVKDATGVFMDYIQEVDTDDRVSLVIYNSVSQTAIVEHHLTDNFAQVQTTVQHRQAGHYDSYTNIGAGINSGRLELKNNGRIGAFKMIVLMTDGVANRPTGVDARQYALQQTDLAVALHYPIVTISLGTEADTDLLQQIADRTGGVHFNIPGRATVTNYREQLLSVFRKIADDRPLILVK
ncbi:MAG: VWA domain-containing protein [Planctomycetia bacterium]|nr:VWA domain-containing protein [Planctomycetia bacterium]